MAKPIRNTPILYGKDAKRFQEDINNLPPIEDRRRELSRVKKGAERFIRMIESLPD